MLRHTVDTSDPGRLLLLDLDGTLVDTAGSLLACINRMLATRSLLPLQIDEIRPMIGDGVAMLVQRALVYRGSKPEPDAVETFTADYERSAADASPLFPGIRAMLGRALQDGWRLAICTNKPIAPTRTLLTALGITHLFAAIGGGDSFQVRKPDPEHLLLTMRQAGGIPERSVMLGDHRNDVLAAQGAGIRALFAGWGYGDPRMAAGAAATVSHPDEVPVLAARLLSSTLFQGRAGY